jgi:heme exporter protein D
MFFESFSEFFAMGRHGFYVWLSYGICFLVLAANVVAPMLKRKKLIEQQVRLQRREKNNAPTA